jgi:hypothetical protein
MNWIRLRIKLSVPLKAMHFNKGSLILPEGQSCHPLVLLSEFGMPYRTQKVFCIPKLVLKYADG